MAFKLTIHIRSTLTIDENIHGGAGRSGLHIRQALFVEEAQLWWDDPHHTESSNPTRGGRSIGNGSSLVLSSVLFHSILERSAPLATYAIKQLRKSPMDLDVYAWLVHRLFSLEQTQHGVLASIVGSVRPQLRPPAQVPALLSRFSETRIRRLPRSQTQHLRRRHLVTPIAPAPSRHQLPPQTPLDDPAALTTICRSSSPA
jgi:hypothetical protein